MPASHELTPPPNWLVWVLVVGAAGITVYAGLFGQESRVRGVIILAATRLTQPPPPPVYQLVDEVIQGASQGRHLFLSFRWQTENHETMNNMGALHWYRGTYVLYPRRIWVAAIEHRPGEPINLPVNAPLPTADWFRQAQVASILELSWDGEKPVRQRLPIPTPGPTAEAAP